MEAVFKNQLWFRLSHWLGAVLGMLGFGMTFGLILLADLSRGDRLAMVVVTVFFAFCAWFCGSQLYWSRGICLCVRNGRVTGVGYGRKKLDCGIRQISSCALGHGSSLEIRLADGSEFDFPCMENGAEMERYLLDLMEE